MPRIDVCATTAVLMALTYTMGCATIKTYTPEPGKPPNGIRVYPPKIYLLVDTCEKKSRVMYAPDFANAYDVKPRTILAKQEFNIELDEGQMKNLTSNQDTTAFLTFIQGATEIAAKAAGVGVSSTSIEGTFGLDDGIWTIDPSGGLVPIRITAKRVCS